MKSTAKADVRIPTPVQTDISMNQERWMAEAARALVEFAVEAQVQGFGIDRKAAVQSLRKAIESI